jgi:hypothetical protein
MTLREIDDAITAWRSRLAAAAQNLMDLQGDPTYQHLSGYGGGQKARLSGITAARVDAALGAMTTVFQHFGLLNETIERAAFLRSKMPAVFGTDQKISEIEGLLQGKSIHLPAVEIPLDQRTLLSGVEHVDCISPAELLDVMVHAFQVAKDTVVAVDAAWQSLGPKLESQARRIRSLFPRAGGDAAFADDLASADRALQEARAKLQSDPLAASSDMMAQVEPPIARIEEAIEARDRIAREVVDGLAAALGKLKSLEKLHQEACAACIDARLKIADCQSLPPTPDDDRIAGLDIWLERLQAKLASGLTEPVAVGLRNWNKAAEDCVNELGGIRAANRAPVEMRNELRGRLDA